MILIIDTSSSGISLVLSEESRLTPQLGVASPPYWGGDRPKGGRGGSLYSSEPPPVLFADSPPQEGGHEASSIVKHVPTEKQSLSLPAETEKFLNENNATWRDLTAIGVIVGPGSFTGIRLGIAYSKGLSMGLGIPLIPINAFEIYLEKNPDAFVAIDSGRGDFFVGAHNLLPQVMTIEEVETKQFDYPQTIGHKPFDLLDALPIVDRKLSANKNEPVIPMYIKPSYAEINCKKGL